MKKIIERRPPPDTRTLDLPSSLHPVLQRVLASRQITSASLLDYSLKNLLSYDTLSGIHTAVSLLHTALSQHAPILIVADFDADGATSCALAIKALRQMGAKLVDFLVPNREKHGYGLTPEIVELALRKPLFSNNSKNTSPLLITVDNGISSVEGVNVAKKQGFQVLITDHHVPPKELPDAAAIVNPNQPQDNFPSKNLAGVGVIFYCMVALRAHLRANGWFTAQGIPEPNLADLLDLIALGTVADVVSLDYNNRILVEQGLRRIRSGHCCEGIRALAHVAGRRLSTLVTNDLGFALGPRLNAAGRMDDMSHGIRCLLSENETDAVVHAQLLDDFNEERRTVEASVQQEALHIVDTMLLGEMTTLPAGVCLFSKHWHPGVVGIVASRIKEHILRPVIIFCTDKNGRLRGSGRSVVGVHIRDIIDYIATQNPGLITHFGGHAMAAGLTLIPDKYLLFKQVFAEEVAKQLSTEELNGIILSDGELTEDAFNLTLAEQIRTIPWGHNFPEPIFDGKFTLVERRVMKTKHLKMKVRLGRLLLEAVAFNTLDTDWPPTLTQIHLAYRLDVNTFRNSKQLQLRAEHIAIE